MIKPYGIAVAAALAVSGMALVGCQHDDNPNANPPASVGGVGGGGSTDSYGTSSNARFKSTGNIGVDSGSQPATPPAPVRNDTTYGNNPPAPAQTPGAPSGGTGGAGSGVYAPGTSAIQGSTTGNEAGAGVRTNVQPANTNTNNTNTTNNNATGGASGAAVGGTNGNGTTYNNAPRNAGNAETGHSETGHSETSGTTH